MTTGYETEILVNVASRLSGVHYREMQSHHINHSMFAAVTCTVRRRA